MLDRLRQQHMFQVAAAYSVAAWLVIQVIATVGPAFDFSDWVLRLAVVMAVTGFFATVLGFGLMRRKAATAGMSSGGRWIFAVALLVALAGGTALLVLRGLIYNERVEIAVMPFDDLSPARDKSFLAEGVAEQILSALGKVEGLEVVGRTTAVALKARGDDPKAIRAGFGITHLLEGSVRSAGRDLRLSVRLIDTEDGREEWSEEFRGTGDEVFALQDRVAAAVAARLRRGGAVEATGEGALTSAEAYNLYLAARQIARTRTEPELRRAYSIAQRVVRGDPNYAPGLSLLAELTYMLSDAPNSYGSIPEARAKAAAIRLAKRAIQLAPEDAYGYAALGLVADGQESLASLAKAVGRDPTRSELYLWTALEYADQARYAEAIDILHRGVELDPLWVGVVNRLVVDLTGAGRTDEAVEQVNRFAARGGDRASAERMRTYIALRSGDLSGAVFHGRAALRLNPATPYVPRYVALALAWMGLRDQKVTALIDDEFPRLLWTGGADAVSKGLPAGANAWDLPSNLYYLFALSVRRDWPALVGLYDRRPAGARLCNPSNAIGILFVPALRMAGRSAEAERLTDCLAEHFAKIHPGGPRHFENVDEAQVAALRGDRDRALALLEKAAAEGWASLSPRLTDHPALDGLMSSPRYAAVQRRLDEWIARERAETLAGRSET